MDGQKAASSSSWSWSSDSNTKSKTSNKHYTSSWIADVEERVKAVYVGEEEEADTFAERAEFYYRKRPQLLNLLQDLYKGYLSLADRYAQTIANNNNKFGLQIDSDYCNQEGDMENWEAESSVSYQPTTATRLDEEVVAAEVVMKTVEYEIMVHELGVTERRWLESCRKIELQGSLLEVMESERVILVKENSRLGYMVTGLLEEKQSLIMESIKMKRKAAELARCVLKMRDDHRVCLLTRKIQYLQSQLYGFQKTNQQLQLQLHLHMQQQHQHKIRHTHNHKHGSWWDRLKIFDFCVCGPRIY